VPILVASTAVPFLMVPLRTRDALRRVRVQSAALSELLAMTHSQGVYAYVSSAPTPKARVSARMLADATLGITEDPATGVAAGPLAATLVHHGAIPAERGKARFVIEQGVDMGRPSYIQAEIDGGPGRVVAIRIAGTAVEVLRGEVEW
jgi:trans-2,3-dihydro-3-hydroxyanthranilate isomerase